MYLVNAWTAVDRLSIKSKSDLSDEIKWDFFQATVVLNYWTWTLTKRREKKLALYKNATSYTEQFLEATPYETTAVRPLTFNL